MIIWSLEVVGVKNHIMAQIFLGRASEIKSFWDLIIGTTGWEATTAGYFDQKSPQTPGMSGQCQDSEVCGGMML